MELTLQAQPWTRGLLARWQFGPEASPCEKDIQPRRDFQCLRYVYGKNHLLTANGSKQLAILTGCHKSLPKFFGKYLPAVSRVEPPVEQRAIAVEFHAHVARRTSMTVEVCPPEMLKQPSKPHAAKLRVDELRKELGPRWIGADIDPRPSCKLAVRGEQHDKLGARHAPQIHRLSALAQSERDDALALLPIGPRQHQQLLALAAIGKYRLRTRARRHRRR